MRVNHILHGVRDDLAGRERVQHATVAHGDAVIDGDGVELLRHTTGLADGLGNDFTDVFQMDVSGDELRV